MVKEVEYIVSGDVQGVEYRQCVAKVGRKLKLVGFAENLENGTVKIRCKGEEKTINEFKRRINVKEPNIAPLAVVEDIKENELVQGTVKETIFKEKYGDTNAEMAQGFSTGMNYMNNMRYDLKSELSQFRVESQTNFKVIGEKIDSGFEKTHESFKHMDEEYDKISEGMFAVVASMEKRMEKTDKNIESLLKILAEKK